MVSFVVTSVALFVASLLSIAVFAATAEQKYVVDFVVAVLEKYAAVVEKVAEFVVAAVTSLTDVGVNPSHHPNIAADAAVDFAFADAFADVVVVVAVVEASAAVASFEEQVIAVAIVAASYYHH